MRGYDPSAIGSDIPRSWRQYLARRCAAALVRLLRLNSGGFFTTEVVQQINPICTIATPFGVIRCKGGHGRLRWRALTFHAEEPETVRWLESIGPDGVLWDIGANVGLYSIYAAKAAGCSVLAVEPEAQNYAILMENIVLNSVQGLVKATNLAISNRFGLGRLQIHALTKGGAYNRFSWLRADSTAAGDSRESMGVEQLQTGVALDDLVERFGCQAPTHIKIDVDGNEPEIVAGGARVLGGARCRSILVEVQRNDPVHGAMLEQLKALGFVCVSERSNWESRSHREREREHPAMNVIFARP